MQATHLKFLTVQSNRTVKSCVACIRLVSERYFTRLRDSKKVAVDIIVENKNLSCSVMVTTKQTH